MKYMGSKARFAKDILLIILRNRGEDQCYVEQVKLLRGMGQRQDKFIGVTEEELLAELMQRRKN